MKNNLSESIAKYLNVDNVQAIQMSLTGDDTITNGLSNDDDNQSNIKLFYVKETNQKIVANVRNTGLYNNLEPMTNINQEENYRRIFLSCADMFGMNKNYIRESSVYKHIDESIKLNMPKFIGNIESDTANICLLEFFEKTNELPTQEYIVDFIAKLHSRYWNKKEECLNIPNIIYNTIEHFMQSKQLFKEMLKNTIQVSSEEVDNILFEKAYDFIENIEENANEILDYDMTFNHGDYSYRNTCLINRNNKIEFCVYDWEYPTYCNPQFDLVNFVLYNDQTIVNKEQILKFVEEYRIKLQKYSNINLDKEKFYRMLELNSLLIFLNRVSFILIGKDIFPMNFRQTVLNNWVHLCNTFVIK